MASHARRQYLAHGISTSYHSILQPTIELLHVVTQESQHDAYDSSKDWEVVYRFQLRDVQCYNMLEATALQADAVQDLTQQLQA
jgi:hypothetical protein